MKVYNEPLDRMDRKALEVWKKHEDPHYYAGVRLVIRATGPEDIGTGTQARLCPHIQWKGRHDAGD